MRRVPKQASSKTAAYFELTKPSITFLILISTALGYFLGGNGIDDNVKFILTIVGSCLVSSGAGALNHFAEMESIEQTVIDFAATDSKNIGENSAIFANACDVRKQ